MEAAQFRRRCEGATGVGLGSARHPPAAQTGVGHWLLARRSIADPSDIAYYVCFGPADTTLDRLVGVAGARWAIEECFQSAKNETGLDHYQVRGYQAWCRHITLSMTALAFLVITREITKKGLHILRRPLADSVVGQRDPPIVEPHRQPRHPHRRPCPALVDLAANKPSTRPDQPPQKTTSQPVVVVLESVSRG